MAPSGDGVIYLLDRVRCCADASDLMTEGAVTCISLLIFLVLRYVVTAVVCMSFMSSFICASVMFLCLLMWVVYL